MKKVVINRLLNGKRNTHGFTILYSDSLIEMFHAASSDAFTICDEGREMLYTYLR